MRVPAAVCVAPAPPTRSASGLVDCRAGMTPVRSVVSATVANVKSRTVTSTWTASSRGISSGFTRRNASTIPIAMMIPAVPPIAASKPVSITDWTMSCRLDAPSASLTAMSRARPVFLAISRFIAFAQVTHKTRATAAKSTSSVERTVRTSESRRPTTLVRTPL